jgi:hypothetical protein
MAQTPWMSKVSLPSPKVQLLYHLVIFSERSKLDFFSDLQSSYYHPSLKRRAPER